MAIERHVREIDRLGEDLKVIQRAYGQKIETAERMEGVASGSIPYAMSPPTSTNSRSFDHLVAAQISIRVVSKVSQQCGEV